MVYLCIVKAASITEFLWACVTNLLLKTCPHATAVPSLSSHRIRQWQSFLIHAMDPLPLQPGDCSQARWFCLPGSIRVNAFWLQHWGLWQSWWWDWECCQIWQGIACLLFVWQFIGKPQLQEDLPFPFFLFFFFASSRQSRENLLECAPFCGSYLSSCCRQTSSLLPKYGRFPVSCVGTGEGG